MASANLRCSVLSVAAFALLTAACGSGNPTSPGAIGSKLEKQGYCKARDPKPNGVVVCATGERTGSIDENYIAGNGTSVLQSTFRWLCSKRLAILNDNLSTLDLFGLSDSVTDEDTTVRLDVVRGKDWWVFPAELEPYRANTIARWYGGSVRTLTCN